MLVELKKTYDINAIIIDNPNIIKMELRVISNLFNFS